MSKTELFDKAQELFADMVPEGATEGEMEEAWEDAMAQAKDILTGISNNQNV